MQIQKADLVLSTAGHDKGSLFFVTAIEGNYAYIANGKEGRRAEKPKKKKLMHLQFIARIDCETTRRLKTDGVAINCELRRDIAAFRKADDCPQQGGF